MSEALKEKYTCYALLLVILLAGSFLRLNGVFEYSYNHYDDFLHIFRALDPTPIDAGMNGSKYMAHPPITFIIQNSLMPLAAGKEEYLRLASIIPSIATILLMYWLGTIISGQVAGLYLAFAFAFSDPLIHLSFNLRPLSLFLFFMAATLVGFAGYFIRSRQRYLLLYFIGALLAGLTHYSAVFVLAGTGLAGFLMYIKNIKRLLVWTIPHIPIVAAIAYFLNRSIWTKGLTFDKSQDYWSSQIATAQAYALSEKSPLTHYEFFVSQASLALAIIGLIFMAIHYKRFKPINLAVWSFIVITYGITVAGLYAYTYNRHWAFWITVMLIPSAISAQFLYEKFMSSKVFNHTKRTVLGMSVFATIMTLVHLPALEYHTEENEVNWYRYIKVGDLDAPLEYLNDHYSYSSHDLIFITRPTVKGQIYLNKFRDMNFQRFSNKANSGKPIKDSEGRTFAFKPIEMRKLPEFISMLESKDESSTMWLFGRKQEVKKIMWALKKEGFTPAITKEFKNFYIFGYRPLGKQPQG